MRRFFSLATKAAMTTLSGESAAVERSYNSAISILHARRRAKRPGNFANVAGNLDQIPDAKGKLDLRGTPSIQGMSEWLRVLGYSPGDVDKLNVIHVAGTKGKGSTCAFAESLLRAYGRRTGFPSKTGLYTSPHLVGPEERIRINFEPIDQALFAKYFFEVWDKLSTVADQPRYLQLYFLLATHVFMREGVEAAIYETHHGGEYDATNVLHQPVATIITPLGMDHAKQLGPTINNIAWHKSGIFKTGSIAFSAKQEPGPENVLRERAAEKQVECHFVPDDDTELPEDSLQLKPDVQRGNCAVALACVRAFIDKLAPRHNLGPLQREDIRNGVNNFAWPGRFQYINDGNRHWFLDGAHNEMSVVKAAEWFIEASGVLQAPSTRILIFGQISEEREALGVLEELAQALKALPFDHILFTVFSNGKPLGGFKGSETASNINHQKHEAEVLEFATMWPQYQPKSKIHVEANLEDALYHARELGKASGGSMHALVTGSLHLVGGTLREFADNGVTRSLLGNQEAP
ncbi:folylpolyglutamate synthase [Xylariaceae sp. FL0255]|nr:folylpolyglutamate synthase [Xylariaceae sp. FL0255]